jgi:hypothetical protein
MISPCYRNDYTGEFVILNTDIRRGIKQQRREWIENRLQNASTVGPVIVIASDVDVEIFDYAMLARHRGGLQGKFPIQTYGTARTWQRLNLDFYVNTERSEIDFMFKNSILPNKTVSFSNYRMCMIFPGQLHMIPYQVSLSDPATALYLAAFDGHREIFMLGFNLDTPCVSKKWQQHVTQVISTYHTHDFRVVGVSRNIPDEWKDLANVECWNYHKFRFNCDI